MSPALTRRVIGLLLIAAFAPLVSLRGLAGPTPDEWEKQTEAGFRAMYSRQYRLAEESFLAALKQSERLPAADERRVASLENLATLYGATGKRLDLARTYKKLLEVRERTLGPDHPDVAMTLETLASLYVDWSKGVPAVDAGVMPVSSPYKQEQNTMPPNVVRVATPQAGMPAGGRRVARLQDALGPAERALAIRESASGTDQVQVLPSVLLLAQIHLGLRQWVEARAHYSRAMAIQESDVTVDMIVADSLSGAGFSCMEDAAYAETEHYYSQALRLYQERLGEEHPVVASVLFNIAVVNSKQKKYEQAADGFRDAIALHEKALGPGSALLLAPLDRYAEVLRKLGRADEAKAAEKRAKQIRGNR